MSKLEQTYHLAIQQTKQKIVEDIDRFLEIKEFISTFDEYLTSRELFVEQIWVNVWINKASNDIPKKEKKQILQNLGYETEGVDKKVINKLFRQEIKNYKPFDVVQWLNEKFANKPEHWTERYTRARESYRKRQIEEKILEKRTNFMLMLEKWVDNYLKQNFYLLYLPVRHYVAKHLQHDLSKNPKFSYSRLSDELIVDGHFNSSDYLTVDDFFEELTGAVQSSNNRGKHSFEYETYYDYYHSLILEFVYEMAPKEIVKQLPKKWEVEHKEIFHTILSEDQLNVWYGDHFYDLTSEILEAITEEYFIDLLGIAGTPFEEVIHLEIFEKHIKEREHKRAEELAEFERKRIAEAKMMEDIFGKAYIPSIGTNLRYVLHIGETNTGKTHRALQPMKAAKSGLYLAPLRLLALEVYDKLNDEGVLCSLKTGEEEKLVEGAHHIASTVEMFHEKDFYEVLVIDEAQMIADKDRGFSWFKAITKANAREVHIIGSRNIKNMLYSLLEGVEIELHEYTRDTPLEVEQNEFELKHTRKGDALICFSRKKVLETAAKLKRSGHSVSMIYGSMPPETRKKQIELFNKGQTKVVVATDAIGMGLNLPIRRVVFLETEKFDGTRRRRLTSQEVKQIAGRAGRKGIYDIGKVAFTADIKYMNTLLNQTDKPVETFAIAPTATVFQRVQHHYRHLNNFFELWEKFDPPKGTKKASLDEELELYELIRGTKIEAQFSMMELYGFLHLPFSVKEPALVRQWLDTMIALVDGRDLPEPVIKRKGLEDFELSYKALGLHLLFLYKLGKKTEAVYWERVREEISDSVHDQLKDEVENFRKKCRKCGEWLADDSTFTICDRCYFRRAKKGNKNIERRR
ncbi:DEAD/DEAH box helicase [Bacillus sp. B15-48]|uniref:DEAD/DEAH box helicase n=1 Tax=Bacillus sp. B15-48 TaxID=1548601 RepID=UPI00193F0D83|nr:DEAD/DEAH box helicase [Bacillus sp. B15-48]MBM4761920.1 RNA helicase [Bacillus sp. B15-48]